MLASKSNHKMMDGSDSRPTAADDYNNPVHSQPSDHFDRLSAGKPTAETAYLFRHALLRDAAYQLQTPGERALHHKLVVEIMEQLLGGRAPEVEGDDFAWVGGPAMPLDVYSEELAAHVSATLAGSPHAALARLECYYLTRAVFYAFASSRQVDIVRIASRLLERKGLSALLAIRTSRLLGTAQTQAGDIASAIKTLESALAQAELYGHEAEFGTCFGALGTAILQTGDAARAGELLGRSVEFHRKSGKLDSLAGMLTTLSGILRETGHLEDALALTREAIDAARKGGNHSAEAFSESGQGVVLLRLGRLDEALQAAKRAIAICHAHGLPRVTGFCYGNLATISHAQGLADEAESAYRSALALHRDTGNREFEGIVIGNLGVLAHDRKQFAQAESMYRRSIEIGNERGARPAVAIATGNLGDLYLSNGRAAEALPLLRLAADEHARCGLSRLAGTTKCTLGLCLLELGHEGDAEAQWRNGISLVAKHHPPERVQKETEFMREACARAGVPPFE